jgi:serine/threonine-protein kinase
MEEMNLFKGPVYRVIIDINQPGKEWETGTYRPGPITSKVVNDSGPLPEGTLLYGQLWTEGVTQENEVVLGRYTEALLPDGRRVPICFILGISGLVTKQEGSKPGEARLRRQLNAIPVERWP